MTNQKLNLADIEQCQKVVIDFMPPPVTEKQRDALEKYRANDLEAVRAALALGSDYESCLCALLKATQDDSSAVECLNEAVKFAVKFAGAADGSELYAKLGEILPEQFELKAQGS